MVQQKESAGYPSSAAKPVAVQAAAAAVAAAAVTTPKASGDKAKKAEDDIVIKPPSEDHEIGPFMRLFAAGKVPLETHEAVAAGAKKLLQALSMAYADPDFQSEIKRFFREAGENQDRYLAYLGPLATRVQKPVFEKFGLPANGRGVVIMKQAVKKLAQDRPELKKLAGDMREQLLLEREEPENIDFAAMMKEHAKSVDKERKELCLKIARAKAHVRGPFARALDLPADASPDMIAEKAMRIQQKAEQLAKQRMAEGRDAVVGKGKLLGPQHAHLSDEELHQALVKMMAGYYQKMLARVVNPLDSFTADPSKFRCEWADRLISVQHARTLWGSPEQTVESGERPEWDKLGIGVAVLDDTVDVGLLGRIRDVLDGMETAGKVSASTDPCNTGARSIWLHFETEEERAKLHPDLLDICMRLAGLPCALMDSAGAAPSDSMGEWPRLRLHPHIMAANYRRGAEYHCHKDSYDGTDNQRMVSVLLYLNPEWRPGDDGQLRVFAEKKKATGKQGLTGLDKSEVDMDRYVDIDPLAGRLVLFRSRDVWHAVREPKSPGLRWALTLWVMAE